jgi:hypothetical protein
MRLMVENFATAAATTVTASSENSRFPASNLKNPFRSVRLRSANTSDLRITFDLATTEDIDSVVLFWPKEDGIRLSSSAVVKIQANATNTWGAPAVDQTLTIDNQYMVASHFFSTNQSYRYWSVLISDAGNANGFLELGLVWLGKGIDVPSAQNGFKSQILDRSKVIETDFGHKYVDVYPKQRRIEINYSNVDYADIQTLENAYSSNGVEIPVLLALDPEEAVFDKNHFLVYGNFSNSFGLGHVVYDALNTEGIVIEELS